MRRRVTTRLLRRPVFLACEGLSERGYGRWLNRLAAQTGIPIAIFAEEVNGGDPLDLVTKSVSLLARTERQRGRYSIRGLLLDADLLGGDQERDEKAVRIADEKKIQLIWQKPTHEAFIVRHFDGCQNHNPLNKALTWEILRTVWPGYTKGMDGQGYGTKLTSHNLANAVLVEDHLRRFLVAAGWP